MREFKWELRRGSQKDICPVCGKRRFVPYVSVLDHKTPAGPEYGRCDREQNCQYHKYPGKKVSTEGIQEVPRVVEPPLRFSPSAVVVARSPLYDFSVKHFGYELTDFAWAAYKVGADGKRTVFWEITKDGEIRAGKSIPYKEDGHRDKNDPFPAGWCHKSRTFDGMHEGKELHQCFFGEHLLPIYPDKRVCVVESEKTALLMSIIYPEYLWIACGGSCGLSDEKTRALRGRKVTLFPDNGQYNRWSLVAQAKGYDIDLTTITRPKFEGCDILDYFI